MLIDTHHSFINRYKNAFGKSSALSLKLANLLAPEYKAHGAWIESKDAHRWLDFGSYGINFLGHTNAVIVNAAVDQISRMGLSSKILASEEILVAAEQILKYSGKEFEGVVFGNTGAEIVELALRVSIMVTERKKIISFENSYHGKSLGALSVSDSLKKYKAILNGFDVEFISVDNYGALESLLKNGNIASVIIEPVQGEGGILPVADEFLETIIALSDKYGTVSIFDEIQTGLGRCGILWRHLHLKQSPDIILSGKTLGGGLIPISALLYKREKLKKIIDDPIISASTFASSPLAGAIATATINFIVQEEIVPRVNTLSKFCFSFLQKELETSRIVKAIRGQGLMIGIEFYNVQMVADLLLITSKHGLLITFCLNKPSVIRFYPPAVISMDDLQLGLSILTQAINEVEKIHI